VSERKWTKGPWAVHHDHPDAETAKGHASIDVATRNHFRGLEIAGMYCMEGERQRANSRLIASAPDLFEALDALLPYAANMLEHDHPVIAKARAALQRAEGEET
jgi:hypothetical protein